MNDEQLEAAARKLCELEGTDPDHVTSRIGTLPAETLWALQVPRIQEAYNMRIALETTEDALIAVQSEFTNPDKEARKRQIARVHNVGNMRREDLDEHVNQLHIVAESLLEYIDCIPTDVIAKLPTMPGSNRDYVERVLSGERM